MDCDLTDVCGGVIPLISGKVEETLATNCKVPWAWLLASFSVEFQLFCDHFTVDLDSRRSSLTCLKGSNFIKIVQIKI